MAEWICKEMQIDGGDGVYLGRVEELVRCKDCRFKECEGRNGLIVCDITGESHQPEWFCADGERR